MEKEKYETPNVQLSELERMIDAFREEFKARTSDADNFITIHEIERMWGELQSNTLNIYSDMLRELMSDMDESELIRKKTGVRPKRDKTANIYESADFCDIHLWSSDILQISFKTFGQRKQEKAAEADRL